MSDASGKFLDRAARVTAKWFRKPQFLASYTTIDKGTHPVPPASGIYAWYFSTIPEGIEAKHCYKTGSLWWKRSLLYVGISNNLHRRIVKCHWTGSMPSSFRDKLEQLTKMRSGPLIDWMDANLRVYWLSLCEKPLKKFCQKIDPEILIGEIEKRLIKTHFQLPLNKIYSKPEPID